MKAIIKLDAIEKIEIYVARCKKTLAQIKAETKADYIINGGMWNADLSACPLLKVNGFDISPISWTAFGYGWNQGPDIAMSDKISEYKNYIACTCLISPWGKVAKPSYGSAQGGKRGRTAIGMTADSLCLYCTSDGSGEEKTPEGLREELYSLGWKSAVMLDSGGSCCCDFLGKKVTTSRKCHNYILVYLKKNTVEKDKDTCPYIEPVTVLRYFSKGEGAKWAQWYLNQHGASLDIDGNFGGLSLAALKKFQRENGLTVDGYCGPATRAKLKAV